MPTGMQLRQDVLNTVRVRVCLSPFDQPLVLHEGQLADEFGVSRTPIRQILQQLAVEGLVDIRTGYGTVARVFKPDERDMAFLVYRELAAASANCVVGETLADDVRISLIGLHGLISSSKTVTAPKYVELLGQIADAMKGLVRDDVLKNALVVSHWRIVRWRAQDFMVDPDGTYGSFGQNVHRIIRSLEMNDASYVLRTAAGISSGFLRSDVSSAEEATS